MDNLHQGWLSALYPLGAQLHVRMAMRFVYEEDFNTGHQRIAGTTVRTV
jgi:hypothetical protein